MKAAGDSPKSKSKQLKESALRNTDSTVTNNLRLQGRDQEEYEREVQLLRSLNHPNILTLIECTPFATEARVVTPYMKHGSLARAIKKGTVTHWTPEKKHEFISGVASAINYLHSRNLVVGRLQPDNVLLDKGYRPVLADICNIRLVTSGQVSMLPSLRYVAPEVIDDRFTRESDIFAFGMFLYCVITGKVPFENTDEGRLKQKIHVVGARPMIPDDTDEFYSSLIRSCWESNPAERPNIGQIIAHLENHFGKHDIMDEVLIAEPDIVDESTKRVFETGEWLDISKFYRSLEDYEQLEPIGRGSAGKIFKYRFKATGELVAVKELNSYRDTDQSRLVYAREVGILGNIRHPTLLQLHGCTRIPEEGSFDCPSVITMYMSGGCLQNAELSKFTATEKHIILYGVAYGMMILHGYRIIHRDLKAGNVFLDERNEPKVADFGLSKYVEENQDYNQSMVCGTSKYMAPELLTNSEFNFKVDVYAFGMLMHYVLTGNDDPYGVKGNQKELRHKVLSGERPNCADIPEPYSSIIKICLDHEAMERPEFTTIVKQLESFPEDVDAELFSQYRTKIQGETSYLSKFEWFEKCDDQPIHSTRYTDVWKAEDTRFHASRVALKVYKLWEKIDQEHFKRELSIVSRFRHPSILPFVGYGTTPDPFIATAFMDNGTLGDMLKKASSEGSKSEPAWDATTKSKCIFGIVTALAFVHQQGEDRVHGNVRPETVYLDDCLEPRLGNFDCAKWTDGEARFFEEMPRYTAPEVLNGEAPTQASDVYSFAQILYDMFPDNCELRGCVQGNRRRSQYIQCVMAGFGPDFAPGTPDFYQELIQACWARDPNDRRTMTSILSEMLKDNRFMLRGSNEEAIKRYQQRILPGLRIDG